MSPHAAGSEHNVRWPLLALAALQMVYAVGWMVFTANTIGRDDIGLFNPIYMYVRHGVMTYPSYGYFNGMFVHPPTHYLVIGLAMKAGVPLVYASAIPVLFLLLLTDVLILRSRFSEIVKASALFGFFAGALLVWHHTHCPVGLSLRPDLHVALAWFAGLVALETARLDDWNPFRLFLGSFLLTYASGLHYPSILAWTGILVYLLWIVRSKGWRNGKKPVLSVIGGACLFGIPYLVLFWIPQWRDIIGFIRSASPTGGVSTSVTSHLALYRGFYALLGDDEFAKVVFYPLRLGIPLVVASACILWLRRETRGLALASLPYLLFLLLAVQRKLTNDYLLPEYMLYFVSIWILVLSGFDVMVRRLAPQAANVVLPVACFVMIGLLVHIFPWRDGVKLTLEAKINEMDVARATGRQMLGHNALVGHRLSRFYTSGAAYSYMIERDLLWNSVRSLDLKGYVEQFDALAEDMVMSEATHNELGESLASWYGKGALALRGFYFSSNHPVLSYMLLAADRIVTLQGYGVTKKAELIKFREQRDGDQVFVAAVCDPDALAWLASSAFFYNSYRLPPGQDGDHLRELDTLIIDRQDARIVLDRISSRCTVREIVPLSRQQLDMREVLATLDDDKPIRFYKELEGLDGALEARYGPAVEIAIKEDWWPAGITFHRGPRKGTKYDLAGSIDCGRLRAEMEDPRGWELHRGTQRARLDFVADGVNSGDHAARYKAGGKGDEVSSPAVVPSCNGSDLTFFSLWVRSIGEDPRLLRLSLQDADGRLIASAFPAVQRRDGWTLLAGWTEVEPHKEVRLAITEGGRRTFLFDKALIVGIGDKLAVTHAVDRPL